MSGTVKDMIEWLQSLPPNCKIEVLEHTRGTGYYDQGGWCSRVDFDIHAVEEWSADWDTPCPTYWELDKNAEGAYTLTLGKTDN